MPGELSLADRLAAGDRGALAAAITLVESRLDQDQLAAEQLLQQLLPRSGNAVRLGITGAPGVGKSTLIEALGTRLCTAGRRVAVLAVDPSSTVTGGSILGDKTRMVELARHPRAFVRPSPGGATAGGVGARTREALLLCEAAGYDIVLVETIGAGQSDTAVAAMVDFFLLVLSPAAGDELQGIKRGVMELCDGVLVHKADGELQGAAARAAQQCQQALQVLRAGETEPPAVVVGSSVTGQGLDELWRAIEQRLANARARGEFARRRAQQAESWLDALLRERVLAVFLADPGVDAALPALRAAVQDGRLLPGAAVRQLLAARAR